MNALTAYERMDDLLSSALPDFLRRSLLRDLPMGRIASDMKLDVRETDKAYLVKAQIPGAKKEDVQVKIDGNFVSISAEVKEEKSSKDDKARSLTQELYYGTMSRGFSLAYEIDEKEAQASFEQGVLSLTLPKRSETSGTTLRIS
ncbi:MAG TPA: Hsp20/alpha crystallin family protein [Burkholderiaceae bacterium]